MNDASFKAVINEIKGRLNIVDVVENFVSLKKSGKDHKGLCPFHDDKNPSMHVNQEKGLFHCFSCGAGGDMFAFLMKYNNISFMDAAAELSRKANVELPRSNKFKKKESSRSGHLFKLNSLVSSYFHNTLKKTKEAEEARKYLKSRGINLEIAKQFSLGFAPDSWDSIVKLGKSRNINLSHLNELGLLVRKDSSGYSNTGYDEYYDRFRNRIIFPIFDVNGYVVGFGGRSINEEDVPKYLNSPESRIFQKRRIFYGLHYSKNEIRKKSMAILVEGYMDFISLFTSGVKNVVATLGTSLSNQHSMLLRRFADEVVIVYDGDESGRNSAIRAGELFLEEGLLAKIVLIPDGLDPDSFVNKHGKDNFLELLDDAEKVADIVINNTHEQHIRNSISSKNATGILIDLVSKIQDPLEKSGYIKKVVNKFGLRESDFVSLLDIKRKGFKKESNKVNKQENSLEKFVLKLLLKYPDLRSTVDNELSDYFVDNDFKVIFTEIINNMDHDVSVLFNSINEPHLQELLTNLIFYSDEISDDKEPSAILKECINNLKLKSVKLKLKLVRDKISEKSGSDNKVCEKKLLEEYRDLVDLEKAIKRNS